MTRIVVLVALAAFSATAGLGCKSLEEKVCSHLGDFVDDGNYGEGECQRDIERLKERCSNPEVVLECFLDKSSEDELGECERQCERIEEAE